MTEEKQLSEQESMQLISRTISEARDYFYESGISGLIYGFSVLLCSILKFFIDKDALAFPFNPFYILIPVFVVQIWLQRKEEKNKQVKTFTDEAIDYVWGSYFLSVIAALSGLFAGAGNIIITIILFLTGFASFVTGAVAKFHYQIYSALLCWVLGAISFFIKDSFVYLLLGIAAVFVWAIPGFILRAKFKKIVSCLEE